MKQILRHILNRFGDLEAPKSAYREPLDTPEISRMTRRELDDLPIPRMWEERAGSCETGGKTLH